VSCDRVCDERAGTSGGRENERMKGSGRAAPNERDQGHYGANKQVRARANARKWKRMIEYVTQSALSTRTLKYGRENSN